MRRTFQHGFTLIEMAIVLAILGLLIGGVLAGQSMLRGSNINKLGADGVSYRLAAEQFKQKYDFYPGDFPTATQVWGRADGGADIYANCAAPTTDSTRGSATCNGNGNGILDQGSNEIYRAWSQLAAAGLISGSFTGVSMDISGVVSYTIGVNAPGNTSLNAAFAWTSNGVLSGNANFFDGDYNNMLLLGFLTPTQNNTRPLLQGPEAFNLDTKYDDGRPGTGGIRTYTATANSASSYPVCASTDSADTAQYAVNVTQPACRLIFMQAFQQAAGF